MSSIQLLAIACGFIAALVVIVPSWKPDQWWFNAAETLIKGGLAFAIVVGAFWLVTIVEWDRGLAPAGDAAVDIQPTATTVVLPTPTTPPTPAPTPTAVPTTQPEPTAVEEVALRTEVFLDLGDCGETPDASAGECYGERDAIFDGWGRAVGPWSGMPFSTGGDATLRDMNLGVANTIIISHLEPIDYLLTVVTGDGACDDSFQIVIEGAVVYEYYAHDPELQSFETHQVRVASSAIYEGQLAIIFRNIATDNCGLAGVFNVRLAPV